MAAAAAVAAEFVHCPVHLSALMRVLKAAPHTPTSRRTPPHLVTPPTEPSPSSDAAVGLNGAVDVAFQLPRLWWEGKK